jgi:hypothetical protein
MLNEQDHPEHYPHQLLHRFLHELFLIKHQDMMICVRINKKLNENLMFYF